MAFRIKGSIRREEESVPDEISRNFHWRRGGGGVVGQAHLAEIRLGRDGTGDPELNGEGNKEREGGEEEAKAATTRRINQQPSVRWGR